MTEIKESVSNDLVKFLTGKWDNISFEIADGKPIKKEEYSETILTKDSDTLTITAHGFKNGEDVTKDMHLEVRGNLIISLIFHQRQLCTKKI